MTYTPRKGETVIVFGETTHFARPFIRFKGINLKRKSTGDYLIQRTFGTSDDGISYREMGSRLAKPKSFSVHRLDLFPGADDVATRAEFKRRIAEWETENPARAGEWKADQEKMRAQTQEITRELSKLMRRFL